ncbi:MAG: 3-deoxy-D-manno-octulosonic acid transferase [Alphaproteobacteria bacterium]|nr:3-deoxy-D-manno-octulosonic acid transferase [Alphaproteobacteria bacterium]
MLTPGLYRGLTTAATPAILLALHLRRRRGKEDPARAGERRGVAGRARPPGPLIWMHAASVGEATSALSLIERLRTERPQVGVLVTTGTTTSAELMARRLPHGAFHQYVPVDRSAWVERFLDHWRPDLALWIESELWPNLIHATRARGVPMALLNARLSERSLAGWRRFPGLIRPTLAAFDIRLAQSPADADRLRALGAPDIGYVGNLKFAARPLPIDPVARAALATAIGGRPRWLAANTHDGEEEIALAAHAAQSAPDLLTMIAPRHPGRGDAIEALARSRGFTLARRSRGEPPDASTRVYLADTLGEMGLVYSLSRQTLIAGSFVAVGGHNPLEAAHFDTAILLGPDRRNNAAAAAALIEADAAIEIADPQALAQTLSVLRAEPTRRDRLARNAHAVVAQHEGVLDAVLARLAPLLDRLRP